MIKLFFLIAFTLLGIIICLTGVGLSAYYYNARVPLKDVIYYRNFEAIYLKQIVFNSSTQLFLMLARAELE
jgi:hypothetical protein